MGGNTTFYIIVAIVVLHFIAGIGWLIVKMSKGESQKAPSIEEMLEAKKQEEAKKSE